MKEKIDYLSILGSIFPCLNNFADGKVLRVVCCGCVNLGETKDDDCDCDAQSVIVALELYDDSELICEDAGVYKLSRRADQIKLGGIAEIISGRNILKYHSNACSDTQLKSLAGKMVSVKIVNNNDKRGLVVLDRAKYCDGSYYYCVDENSNFDTLPDNVRAAIKSAGYVVSTE